MMGVPYDEYAPYDPRAAPPMMEERRKGGGYDVKGGKDASDGGKEGPPAIWDPVYEYPVPLQVRNTFFEMAGRSPSFDEFMEERKVQSSPAAYDPGDEPPPTGYDGRPLRPHPGAHSGFEPGHRHSVSGVQPPRPSLRPPASTTREHRFDDQHRDHRLDDHHRFDDHHRDHRLDDHHDNYRRSMPSATNSAALAHQLVHGVQHESLEPMMIGSYSSIDRACHNSSVPAWRIPQGQRSAGRHQRQDGPSHQHPPPHQQPPPPRWIDPPDQSPNFAAHQRNDAVPSPSFAHQRSEGVPSPNFAAPPRSDGVPMSANQWTSHQRHEGAPSPNFAAPPRNDGVPMSANQWTSHQRHEGVPSPNFAAPPRNDGVPMSANQWSSGQDHPRPRGSLHLAAPVADEPPDFSSDDDGELRINSQTAELGSIGCPTLGSRGHTLKMCKPCAFSNKGCQSGMDCTFCHLCEVGEKKRRKKEKVAFRREIQKWRQNGEGPRQGRAPERAPQAALCPPGSHQQPMGGHQQSGHQQSDPQQSDPRQLAGHQQSYSSPDTPTNGGDWRMGNFW